MRKCLNNGWTPKTEHVVGITFQHSASDFMVAFDACDNGLTPTLILCSAFHEIPWTRDGCYLFPDINVLCLWYMANFIVGLLVTLSYSFIILLNLFIFLVNCFSGERIRYQMSCWKHTCVGSTTSIFFVFNISSHSPSCFTTVIVITITYFTFAASGKPIGSPSVFRTCFPLPLPLPVQYCWLFSDSDSMYYWATLAYLNQRP